MDLKNAVLERSREVYEHVFGPLQRREHAVLCPFHSDRSPSLSINTEKGVWYCQPCATGGDCITLMMKVCNLTFKDALNHCAQVLGLVSGARIRYDEVCEARKARKIRETVRSWYSNRLTAEVVSAEGHTRAANELWTIGESLKAGEDDSVWGLIQDHLYQAKMADATTKIFQEAETDEQKLRLFYVLPGPEDDYVRRVRKALARRLPGREGSGIHPDLFPAVGPAPQGHPGAQRLEAGEE